jgi:hypothetical protein
MTARAKTNASPNTADSNPDAELVALAEQFESVIKRMRRYDDPPEHLHTQLQRISEAVSRLPAISLAGLRAKTIFALEACSPYWDQRMKDMEWEDEHARSVIEAACVIVGLPIPKEQLPETEALPDGPTHPGSEALN